MPMMKLDTSIRDIPDFPKKGIVFKDITTLLNDKVAYREAIDELVKILQDKEIDQIVAAESRGFIFGGALAYKGKEEVSQEERGGGAIAYAGKKGEVRKDTRGMAEARALGITIAKTIKTFRQSGLM